MRCQMFHNVGVDSLQYSIGTLQAVHSAIMWSCERKAREGLRGFGGANGGNITHPILVVRGHSDLFVKRLDDLELNEGEKIQLSRNILEREYLKEQLIPSTALYSEDPLRPHQNHRSHKL